MTALHRWTITTEEHTWFTAFSGDSNPIHDDPVAARRLLGGRMLAHGAHLLLRALDQAARAGELGGVPASIRVVFRSGVAPGDPLLTTLTADGDALTIDVVGAGGADRPVATIDVDRSPTTLAPFEPPAQHPRRPSAPRALDLASLAALAGTPQPTMMAAVDPDGCREWLPAVTAVLGAGRVAEIAAISCVVGMLTPGQASMSSSYEISWRRPDAAGDVAIAHTVERVDPRLRRVVLSVRGASMDATVTAFSPPAPVDQGAVLSGGDGPRDGEFSGWRVLVVGGSRGLGEASARLLVAGGADVLVTWCTGRDDAERAAGELGIVAVQWCTPDDPGLVTGARDWLPTHVCWFAAPAGDDDPMAHDVEIASFERVLGALPSPPLVGALWPSTDLLTRAVDERPPAMRAWADRKAAGEAACARLAANLPAVMIHTPRLPMLLSDRTQSLVPREYGDTATELLRALRALPSPRPDGRAGAVGDAGGSPGTV